MRDHVVGKPNGSRRYDVNGTAVGAPQGNIKTYPLNRKYLR